MRWMRVLGRHLPLLNSFPRHQRQQTLAAMRPSRLRWLLPFPLIQPPSCPWLPPLLLFHPLASIPSFHSNSHIQSTLIQFCISTNLFHFSLESRSLPRLQIHRSLDPVSAAFPKHCFEASSRHTWVTGDVTTMCNIHVSDVTTMCYTHVAMLQVCVKCRWVKLCFILVWFYKNTVHIII